MKRGRGLYKLRHSRPSAKPRPALRLRCAAALSGGTPSARYRGVRQALALTAEVFDESPSAPGPPDSGESTVSGPGCRTVCRKTISSEQHVREFVQASGRLAKTDAIDAAKDFSGPRYRTEIVALQLRMLGNGVNGTAPKAEASEKVSF